MRVLIVNFNNKLDSIIAFFSGDILATVIYSWYMIDSIDWIHPALKVAFTLVIGVVGGFGGLLGRDIYETLKKKLKL